MSGESSTKRPSPPAFDAAELSPDPFANSNPCCRVSPKCPGLQLPCATCEESTFTQSRLKRGGVGAFIDVSPILTHIYRETGAYLEAIQAAICTLINAREPKCQ